MDGDPRRVSLAGRLAARAVTLAVDAATSSEDVVDHLVLLARGDPAVLDRAARQVERRHPHPESAPARHAAVLLRLASSLAATMPSVSEGTEGVWA